MQDTVALYALGGVAALAAVSGLKRRLELSRAKHPSLGGHSRLASWLAKRVPFYEYDEDRFFRVDDAPEEVARSRRAAFMRLSSQLQQARPKTLRLTAEVEPGVSDLQLTAVYRVPFQFSRMVRRHLSTGAFTHSSSGVMVSDLDDNRSYDLAGSYGVNVFGYDFYKECLVRALERVADLGPVLGSFHPVVVDNVKRLRHISGLDEVSFHMSGTEAVMQAVRLARYHTGRSHLVRFCGAYHGWWDDVQPGVGNPTSPRDTYTLKDISPASLHVLRTRKDIACVLVNPLQALHPNAGAPSDSTLLSSARRARFDRGAYTAWLKTLREVCTAKGIVLIFDEVFLGFRVAQGGAQEYFGVRADMVTYGKTLAAGLPIGVVCGRGHLMRRFRDDRPSDICFARGTFNAHPYVMAAMHEFLQRLETVELRRLYGNLDQTWNTRAESLNSRLRDLELPVSVANLSSIWTVLYSQPSSYNWMFQYYLRAQGLALSWVGTGRLIFSLNYTDADFQAVADRFELAAVQMRSDGWWRHHPSQTNQTIHRRILREMFQAKLWSRTTASAPDPFGVQPNGQNAQTADALVGTMGSINSPFRT